MNKINSKIKNLNKLTSWEWEGLNSGYNIADGHAHQEQSPEYKKIIKKLPQLYLSSEARDQQTIQSRFEEVFFTLAGQKSYKKLPPPLYQTSCSLSIEVVANYLRMKKKSVTLLHPTFDNLADILKRHDIVLKAIEEEDLIEPEKRLQNLETDVLFLVCPNNPTGTELTKEQFFSIVKTCKKYNKLLIIDNSFRFYSSFKTWDQYEILQQSGIDFVVFEDTGKTWPTLELKLGITLASTSLYQELKNITNDFLLNVSPFIFTLLTEYISIELKNPSYHAATEIVSENRLILEKIIKNLPLTMINPNTSLSVAWMKLPAQWEANAFCRWLAKCNVHVLPGSPFFWNNPQKGKSFFRIALLRPQKKFSTAIHLLQEAVLAIDNKKGIE